MEFTAQQKSSTRHKAREWKTWKITVARSAQMETRTSHKCILKLVTEIFPCRNVAPSIGGALAILGPDSFGSVTTEQLNWALVQTD